MTRPTSLALVLVLAGCSSSATQIRARSPWDPELAGFFDDAVDFIANPSDLEGTWASDYAAEFRGRIDAADLIARVHVTTLREDIAVDGSRQKHVLMEVTSVITGVAPEDRQLHVSVDEGSAGFDTVDRNARRILDNRFVAYIRWYENDEHELRSHWHLSPASREVVEATTRALAEREQVAPDSAGEVPYGESSAEEPQPPPPPPPDERDAGTQTTE